MFKSIEPLDIYNKNINVLLGSGASADLFPTLALKVKSPSGKWQTIETLATTYADWANRYTALFMHYYNTCIYPVQNFSPENVKDPKARTNLDNYENFIVTILGLLDRRKDLNRKINIFTTNYDGCLAHSADNILANGSHDFVINDGASGFHKKILHAKNFSTFQCQTGIFERSHYGIPQINLIHLHGSVYWSKDSEKIEVRYKNNFSNLIHGRTLAKIQKFSDYLVTDGSITTKIPNVDFTSQQRQNFWNAYNKLPIVNPTKWKFHETVFEEHYYQMLRLLSYELEKPNSILIVFGFSFADEHILKLIQRSLANPKLQTLICCYSKRGADSLTEEFKPWRNVTIISPPAGENLDFTNFNKYVFSLKPQRYIAPDHEENLV
ncbi:hypothetical protein EGM97_17480 [Pseudomonas sp. AF32]|uniref:SIR2 family protein n=1 Tax=Pseudomonas sp. AF32 TaxID=554390 RepID=UPI001EEEBE51|nr:SIR2 family protein [Pseudomonas sp. AF32]MCG6576497.1 hypothetical protein [Pseudomonas sp. AF32]